MWFSHKNILVVDDDSELLVAADILLRASGYRIRMAPDAGSAWRAAVENTPDLILLDLGLPGGDGLEILDWLKHYPPTAHIPVIVITARDQAYESQALANGASAFLQKPVDNEELREAIGVALQSHQAVPIR